MATINLKWTPRVKASEQRVYRAESPISLGSLPTPIATLGALVRSYEDTSAVAGTTYYYRIGTVLTDSPDVIALSNELSILAQAEGGGGGSGSGSGSGGIQLLGSAVLGLSADLELSANVGVDVAWERVISDYNLGLSIPSGGLTEVEAPTGTQYAIAYFHSGDGTTNSISFCAYQLRKNLTGSPYEVVAQNQHHNNEFNTLWVGGLVPLSGGETLSAFIQSDSNSAPGAGQTANHTRFTVAFYG